MAVENQVDLHATKMVQKEAVSNEL